MQQRNVVASLVSFMLILAYFGLRVFQMTRTGTFIEPNVFRLWGIVIAASILLTIFSSILAQILFAIIYTVTNQAEPPATDLMEDERDKLITLKGSRISYIAYGFAVLAAMLTFVFNQPPLVMFTVLIAAGLVAQIAGDVYRLIRYGQGA